MASSPSCEYCGRCLSVCPSYKHHLVETMGPRARIDLARAVQSGDLEPGERYFKSIGSCMQCLACTEICGKGVDGAGIVLEARLAMGAGKLTFKRRLERFAVAKLLLDRGKLRRCLKLGASFQKIFSKDAGGSIRHLPDMFSGIAGRRSLPQLAPQTIHELLPETVPAAGDVSFAGDVALFTGCFGGLIQTDAAVRLVKALTARGYAVHLPKAQSCCGAPALFSGFGDAFAKAGRHNDEVFGALGDMPILTMCATCNRTLSREYAEKFGRLSSRVIDASVFLERFDAEHEKAVRSIMPPMPQSVIAARGGRPVTVEDPLVVAVHDPCHLRLNRQAGKALRAELAAKPWIKLVELADRGSCCGGGGVSSLKNPDIADELGEARAKAVLKSGADVVTAQCPGCVLQLNNHLAHLKAESRAVHAMELLGA